MSMRWTERAESRHTTSGESAIRTDHFAIVGTTDSEAAYQFAVANASPLVIASGQVLFRQDMRITHQGNELWYVEVPYGPKTREPMEWRLSSSTSGRTQRVFQSKETVDIFGAANPPDHKGAIDVQNGEVRGADIVVPTTRLTYELTLPPGTVSEAYILYMAKQVGKKNAAAWHGMRAGEALFVGHYVEQGSNQKRTMRFEIEHSAHLDPVAIAGIANVEKEGWDLAWELRKDDVDEDEPVKPANWIYIERVYDSINFTNVLGF